MKHPHTHTGYSPFGAGNDQIIVKGARTHNLKNITVSMPRNTMIAITGLSGSGKSSLAFDTIFAEGQRRYVESLSSYARQFLHQMQKPDVDEIVGLSPAISIDQKSRSNNPRSTVATITEIYDYLRVLFARIGKPKCLLCDREISKLSKEEIINFIKEKVTATNEGADFIEIFAPIVRGRKGEYYQLLYSYLDKGYQEVLIDGERKKLREKIVLGKQERHNISILVDRFKRKELTGSISEDAQGRLLDAVERALEEAEGLVSVVFTKAEGATKDRVKSSAKPELAEALSSLGANPKDLTFLEEIVLSSKFACPHDGYSFPEVEPRLFSFNSPYGACPTCNGLGTEGIFDENPCKVCKGARLRPESLNVFIDDINIIEYVSLSIKDAEDFLSKMKLTEKERTIASVVLKEIQSRLRFMLDVGIDYLTLDRRAHTLSGGEAQRIRLASQLGSGLVGALYVLDEPTIGLHSRDNDRLINTLTQLRDAGNNIIVGEHDEDTILASNYLIDIGPGAGVHGGNVVVSDYVSTLLEAKTNKSGSLTLSYLRGDEKVEVPKQRRNKDMGHLSIKNGSIFNIKDISTDIPLGKFIMVTGVSGSGKSSFLYEIVHKNLEQKLERGSRGADPINCKEFKGWEQVGRVVLIDQSPIGRTPRSNPATYTGAFTFIRDLFSATTDARVRGWKPNRFSFNVKGGRCEACQGNGEIAVEMHFLPTVYVLCDVCNGTRYMKETLEVKYKHKNIHDVLEMTIEEANTFFKDLPAISDRLQALCEVGLGYLKLGQSATTLSGGEAQRVKVASELYRRHVEKTVYLLDEPTIGLHYEDVKKLIEILQKLVDKGNTVMVIEHNMDMIKSADYVIDIGPEGGTGGGKLVAKGTPEDVARNDKSHTGKYLKRYVK